MCFENRYYNEILLRIEYLKTRYGSFNLRITVWCELYSGVVIGGYFFEIAVD